MPSVTAFSIAKIVADIAGRKADSASARPDVLKSEAAQPSGERSRSGEGEFGAMVAESRAGESRAEEARKRRHDRIADADEWRARRAEARSRRDEARAEAAKSGEEPEGMAPEPRPAKESVAKKDGKGLDEGCGGVADTKVARPERDPVPVKDPGKEPAKDPGKVPDHPAPKDAKPRPGPMTDTVTCGTDGSGSDTVTCGTDGSTTDTVTCGEDPGRTITDTVTCGTDDSAGDAVTDGTVTDTVICAPGPGAPAAGAPGGIVAGAAGESAGKTGAEEGVKAVAGSTEVAKVAGEAKLDAAIKLAGDTRNGTPGENGTPSEIAGEIKPGEAKPAETKPGEIKSEAGRTEGSKAFETAAALASKTADLNPTRMARFSDLVEGFNPSSAVHRPADILAGLDRSVQATALNQRIEVSRPTPLQMLPIEIGMHAVRGVTNFQIRLDPAELGRVDVRLQIRDSGEVSATLVVDRVETLNLLRRDASTLANAFEQAGLKQGGDGLSFSLRGENPNGGQGRGEDGKSGGQPEEALPQAAAEIAMRRAYVSNSSLDLMV